MDVHRTSPNRGAFGDSPIFILLLAVRLVLVVLLAWLGHVIHIPPLRERREDIAGLCNILSARIASEMKVPQRPLSQAAIGKLTLYAFPGNIRELRNLLERAHLLGRLPELQPEDFPMDPGQLAAQLPEHLDLRKVLGRIEITPIDRALCAAGGVQAEAARRLNLSRSDFGYKVAKYALGNRQG